MKPFRTSLLAVALVALHSAAFARQAAAPPAPTRVADLGWIAGAWTGTIGDDPLDEVWLPPDGGAMVGVFRWIKSGEVYLYELMSLEASAGGVVLKLKHFGPDLVGREPADDAVVFDLVESREGLAAFAERGDEVEGTRLVYQSDGEAGLTVTFAETRDGEPVELVFRYRRR